MWLGLLCHVGPLLAYAAFLAWQGMTVFTAIVGFFVVAFPLALGLIVLEIARPARALRRWDIGLCVRELVRLWLESFVLGYFNVALGWWLAGLARSALIPNAAPASLWLGPIAAVVALDFGYYWWHREVLHGRGLRWRPLRWMRRQHARHHDVEDLDLFRGNVFSRWDALWSHQFPLGVVCGLLGVGLPGTFFAFGLTMIGFSTHHVNHTFALGWLRALFVDNHAHKLHHCKGGGAYNLGNFFSVWDRLFGTFHEDWSRCATEMHARGVPVYKARSRPGFS